MRTRTHNRAAQPRDGAAGLSQFAEVFAPAQWGPLLDMFGTTVEYTPAGATAAITVEGIWKEGAEAEARSPGRYSTFDVCDADIPPNGPSGKDQVYEPSRGTFYVDRVLAFAIGYSHLTLKETP
jgi:hypothetical protein